MCAPVILVVAAVAAAAAATAKAVGDAKASAAQAEADRFNASASERAASDALIRGETTAYRVQERVDQTVGVQRVGYAAGNVDVASGSALQTQLDSATMGAADEDIVRNNAEREAYGFKVQGINYLQHANAVESAAGWQMAANISSGVSSVASVVAGGLKGGVAGSVMSAGNNVGGSIIGGGGVGSVPTYGPNPNVA